MLPVMLASLVTNDKPDVLATAYAPSRSGLCQDLAISRPCCATRDEGRFRPPVPEKRSCLGRPCVCRRMCSTVEGAAVPCIRHLLRSARRTGQGSGGSSTGHSQPCPQSGLSRTPFAAWSIRTSAGATAASSPSPVTAFAIASARVTALVRWPRTLPWQRDGRQDLAGPGRLFDPLPRHICAAEMGPHHEACRPHRPAHLLPHPRRRLELIVRHRHPENSALIPTNEFGHIESRSASFIDCGAQSAAMRQRFCDT